MKKELPIAVVLLAFGAWCCLQFPSEISDVSSTSAINIGSAHSRPIDDTVVQTSWQSPVTEDSPERDSLTDPSKESQTELETEPTAIDERSSAVVDSKGGTLDSAMPEANAYDSVRHHHAASSDTMRTFPPDEFLQVANRPDVNATAAIQSIANGLVQAPAFATHTEINSMLFGVAMAAQGKYFQTAGGSKSRMEIQCYSPLAQTVLQMSDGRFVYILKSNHKEQRLEFIDLFRLANNRGQANGALLPTTWVMGGGMGKAISNYADAFDFRAVSPADDVPSASNLMRFRGIWKAETLLHLINTNTPVENRPEKVVWSDVPRQLPHAIELTFEIIAGQTAVPKQISFFQFRTEKKHSSAKEMVRIEFSPFEFRNGLPDELFTLESTDFEAIDVTKVYNAKIEKLSEGMDKVANTPTMPPDFR